MKYISKEELIALHDEPQKFKEFGGVNALFEQLNIDPKEGIPESDTKLVNMYKEAHPEADVHGHAPLIEIPKREKLKLEMPATLSFRQRIYGTNAFPERELDTFYELCRDGLKDPILIILMISGLISFGLGIWENPRSGWTEGISITFAVVLVDIIGAVNQYTQQKQFAGLDKSKQVDLYTVVRNGVSVQVDPVDIQVGDIVKLFAGSFIPADGFVISEDMVKVNESSMTGESKDIVKSRESPKLFAGTEIREGQAVMIVTAVGIFTTYGRILMDLTTEEEETPLQQKLEIIVKWIAYFGIAVALIMFIALFIKWLVELIKDKPPTTEYIMLLVEHFIICVAIIVMAVPEGLPLAVILSLAYSMKRMMTDNLLSLKLDATETMGNCTAICTDKTGTLTQNLMTVMKAYVCDTHFESHPQPDQLSPEVFDALVSAIAVNSKVWIDDIDKDKKSAPERWKWKDGNQTEISLVSWLTRVYDIDVQAKRAEAKVIKAFPFDSIKKCSSVIVHFPEEKFYRKYFKGAADTIVDVASKIINKRFEIVDIDKPHVVGQVESFTKTGLRTIGFGYVDFTQLEFDEHGQVIDPFPEFSSFAEFAESDDVHIDVRRPFDNQFIFIGCVGIKDPLRPESRDSVLACQESGVIVRMVTGDHLETAKFIARDCGIFTSDDYHIAMTGPDFRKLAEHPDKEYVREKVTRLRILARSTPEDKKILVTLLQSYGEVVAATGDGTNDAPALRKADIGLCMYIQGTAVAKKAAKMWIMDDKFTSIVKSIMWGRSVYDSVRKFIQFQLVVNIVALGITLIGILSQKSNPLKAIQLLWVNLIMDTFAALALATDLPTDSILKRRPYKLDAPIISKLMWRNIIGTSAYQLFWMLFLLYSVNSVFPNIEADSKDHYTLIFNVFVWLQVFGIFNARKVNEERNVFQNVSQNHVFIFIIIVIVLFQALIVELFGPLFVTTGQTNAQWWFAIGIGATTLISGALIREIPVELTDGQTEIDPRAFEDDHHGHDTMKGGIQLDNIKTTVA